METIAILEFDNRKLYSIALAEDAYCDVMLVYESDTHIPDLSYVMQCGDGGTVYSSTSAGDSIGCVENYGFSEDAIVQFVLMTL